MTARFLSRDEKNLETINFVINQIGQGRSNANGIVTLTPSDTSTTVTAENCGEGSGVWLMPTTANARTAFASLYIGLVQNGSFVITHASSADTDQTFFWVALG